MNMYILFLPLMMLCVAARDPEQISCNTDADCPEESKCDMNNRNCKCISGGVIVGKTCFDCTKDENCPKNAKCDSFWLCRCKDSYYAKLSKNNKIESCSECLNDDHCPAYSKCSNDNCICPFGNPIPGTGKPKSCSKDCERDSDCAVDNARCSTSNKCECKYIGYETINGKITHCAGQSAANGRRWRRSCSCDDEYTDESQMICMLYSTSNIAGIIGGVVGAVIFVIIVITVVCLVRKNRRLRALNSQVVVQNMPATVGGYPASMYQPAAPNQGNVNTAYHYNQAPTAPYR